MKYDRNGHLQADNIEKALTRWILTAQRQVKY
jgi:hypothetical protein